jgi:hypothetical protein
MHYQETRNPEYFELNNAIAASTCLQCCQNKESTVGIESHDGSFGGRGNVTLRAVTALFSLARCHALVLIGCDTRATLGGKCETDGM